MHRLTIQFSKLILPATLLVILGSCSKQNPLAPNPNSIQIVPLAVGNSWSYDGISYDTAGSVLETYGEIHTVQKDSSLGGRSFYVYDGLCVNADSGMVQAYPTLSGVDAFLVYKYPARQGDVYSSDNLNVTVSSLDTLLQTSAGSFHCIKFAFTYYAMRYQDEYVSPGVGRIKRTTYYVTGSPSTIGRTQDEMQLQSYVLK